MLPCLRNDTARPAKRKRFAVKDGYVVFVRGEDVPYQLEGNTWEAEPPAAVVAAALPGDATSKKWMHLRPLDPSLGPTKQVHISAVVPLDDRYTEVRNRHGPGTPMAAALHLAVHLHAQATKRDQNRGSMSILQRFLGKEA